MSRDEFCFQFPDDIDQLNQASHAVWRVSLGIGELGTEMLLRGGTRQRADHRSLIITGFPLCS